MNADVARSRLIEFGRLAHQRNWIPATSGNFSQRTGADEILVTASGVHKGYLGESDFLRVTLDGQALDPVTPSAETCLHLQLYRHFPAINCVLHVHPLAATLLAEVTTPTLCFAQLELLKAFEGIDTHETRGCLPVVPNSQDMQVLAAAVKPFLDQPILPAYLIRGHGVYVWGRDYAAAFRHLEALDFLLTCAVSRPGLLQG
jgi:methylthioribulose-1-phosphate dehydratase